MKEDPQLTSLAKGLEGLDEDPEHSLSVSYSVSIDLRMLVTTKGELTPLGKQRMRLLARQIAKGSHDLSLRVGNEDDLPKAITMAMYMSEELNVPWGRVSLGVTDQPKVNGQINIVIARRFERN